MRLLVWSGGSIVLGVGMVVSSRPTIEGIGLQMVIWGMIDAVLALAGLLRARRMFGQTPEEHRAVRETLRLRRILVVNGRLDLFYIVVGAAVVIAFRNDRFPLGNGIGILIQSMFLFFFDRLHAGRLPARSPAWYDGAQ